MVLECVRECLKKENWAMVFISLQNMDAFREQYGFVASNNVIRAVSLMVQTAHPVSEDGRFASMEEIKAEFLQSK